MGPLPYRVDPGSPSEEAGLQVGDQLLDINGHSFLSILHFEAVHILKSYATLIMTVKVSVAIYNTCGLSLRIHSKQSLGRIPVLQDLENTKSEGEIYIYSH